MKYVFGPVPSRRLGKSLGIDPVPLKTCNWNCVYCQLGRTRPLTNLRREYTPRLDILAEVERTLAALPSAEIDWMTFVGSGEPTLHSSLGWLVREVKSLSRLPTAVITNGALLYLPDIRSQLSAADAVLPSLDAGNPRLFRKINRPWPKLTFDHLLNGLVAFRKEYSGKLWLEVMLVQGLNDTEEALQGIAAAIDLIRPDRVHINVPVRPPAEGWVQPADESGLRRARAILGARAVVLQPASVQPTVNGLDDLGTAILGIISRHPMQEAELCSILGVWTTAEVHQTLEALHADHKAQVIERYGEFYWSAATAYYAVGCT
jgi:wyosine [tRNA(Phe)-imidazoG37] synthetase (radical SAM superfamily)